MTTEPMNVTPPPGATGGASRTPVIVLSIVGGVLLLTVVALLFLFIGRGMGGPTAGETTGPLIPSASATPSATPTPTQTTAAPPPEDTTPRFTFFSALTEVRCPNSGDKPEIQVAWETAYAVQVWYTAGDDDAVDDAYMQVPLAGTQNDLTDEHLFPCAHREFEDYTITLLGPGGEHVSKTWRVTDLNWNSGGGDDDD